MIKFLLFMYMGCLHHSLLSAQNDSSILVFQHANVIDGISKNPLKNVTVTVEKGKITSIQKQLIKPSFKAIVIDLTDKWLLPGYIDAHVHFFNVEAAQRALTTGVTTARTMQCDHFLDIDIREDHRKGRADLPDIVAAGYQIRPDMHEAFYKDFPELSDLKPLLSGAENVRRVVRALVSRNVDHIKVLATERAGTPGTDPMKQTFTSEELKAIVEEAKKNGLHVAAHAHGDEGAAAAVLAGVRTIEHGTYLSEQTLNMMKSRGVFFDPTFSFWREAGTRPLFQENTVLAERVRTFPLHLKKITALAYEKGIPIVGGTDFTYNVPGLTIYEEAVKHLDAGLPAMEVIRAITHKAALCLGIAGRTGAIKKGLEADMVVVTKNPLDDLSALNDIVMIINDGKIAVNRLNTIHR